MRYMTLCVGLIGFLVIGGCQNTELLQCQEDSAVLVTQAAELQNKLKSQKETSEKTFLLLMEESIKSKKEFDALALKNQTQQKNFQQKSIKQQAELKGFKDKISTSAKILVEIRKQLQKIVQENAELKEKVAQSTADSASDGDVN